MGNCEVEKMNKKTKVIIELDKKTLDKLLTRIPEDIMRNMKIVKEEVEEKLRRVEL